MGTLPPRPDLVEVLRQALRLMDEALPKFDWKGAHLDANAIDLLNTVPPLIRATIANETRDPARGKRGSLGGQKERRQRSGSR